MEFYIYQTNRPWNWNKMCEQPEDPKTVKRLCILYRDWPENPENIIMLVYCIRLTWRTWNCKVNTTRYYDRISDPRRSLKEWYQSSGYNPQNSFQCRHSVHSVLNTGLVRSRSEDRSSDVRVSWFKWDSNLFMFRQRKACDGSRCNWSDRLALPAEGEFISIHFVKRLSRRVRDCITEI